MPNICTHGNLIAPPGRNCLSCIAVQASHHAFDHADAWNVSHHKIGESNLARCYIELRDLARKADAGPLNVEDTMRLRAIVHSNDL